MGLDRNERIRELSALFFIFSASVEGVSPSVQVQAFPDRLSGVNAVYVAHLRDDEPVRQHAIERIQLRVFIYSVKFVLDQMSAIRILHQIGVRSGFSGDPNGSGSSSGSGSGSG
jgi:hypothetical protein